MATHLKGWDPNIHSLPIGKGSVYVRQMFTSYGNFKPAPSTSVETDSDCCHCSSSLKYTMCTTYKMHFNSELSKYTPGVMPFEEVWNRSHCRAIEVLVDVVREYPSEAEYIFKPSCVPLLRCAGCCGDEKLRCTVREMYNVTIQVIKLKPLDHVTSQEEKIFTEHSSCECRRRRKRLKGDRRNNKRKGQRRRTKIEDMPELNQCPSPRRRHLQAA